MMGILPLLLGLSTVDGLLLYEAQEGENVTLWAVSTRADLSSVHIACLFKPTVAPYRRVFDMEGGVETTEQQDSQFSGRVQCDRSSEGLTQVRIILTAVTAQDLGDYTCEMADATGHVMTVEFVINVTPSDSAVGNPYGEQRNEDSNNQTHSPKPRKSFYNQSSFKIASIAIIIVLMIMAFLFVKLVILYYERKPAYFPCEKTTLCLTALETSTACPSVGADPCFHVVLPEVSSFPTGFLKFFLAGKKGQRTGDV